MTPPPATLVRRTEALLRDAGGICCRADLRIVSRELIKLADAWKPYLSEPRIPVQNVVRHDPSPYESGGRLEWFAKVRAANRRARMKERTMSATER